MGNWFTACISPLLFIVAQDLQVDITTATRTITYVVMAIGLSVSLSLCALPTYPDLHLQNMLAVPISQYIGKRYTILLGLSVFLGCNIWCIYASDYNSFLAARILGGFGAGIVEALGPLIVAETFPERSLASAMVIYVLSLGAGASFGPFVAGLLANGGYYYRWNFKILSVILGANLLSCLIMLPETVDRDLLIKDDIASTLGDVEKTEDLVREEVDNSATRTTTGGSQETLMQLWKRRTIFLTLPDIKPERNFFILIIQPFTLLVSPAVSLGCLIFGLMIAYTFISSVVLSQTLQSPPILWPPLQVGLLNLSTVIGLVIGIPIGGIAADILSRRSAKRNDGFHMRESRLPAVIPGAVLAPIGVLVIGICLQNDLSWAGMAIGWAMLNIALTASANVMLTYAVDCYPWRAAHIGVVVNTLKNLVAFGVGYSVTPWLEAVGPEKQFGTMAGILWFFFLLIIPLSIFGPRLRQWSLKWVL